METRIRIATPFGTDFQIVPHFLSAQPVWPFRDKATMSLHYPRAGVNDALLNSECEAVFEYHNGTQWVEPLDSRYKLAGRDNDRLEDVPTRRFDFIALLPEMLEHAKVWEPAGLQTDTDGNILFAAVTPGVIIKTLFDNARGRGWGPQLNLGFSTTHDSNGQPWAGVVNLALDPAQSIFEVLSALGNQGIVDWAGQGRTLQMYNPDTYLGRDLQSVRLLAYDGETSAPTQVSYRDRATVLRVVGDGGNNWDRANGTSPWGRLESIMSAGGVSDEGTAFLMSDEELLKASAARVSRTREFDGVSKFLPHRDFRGGDHVRYQTENGVEKMRVFSMSLTIDDRLSGYAVLGDRFEDALIAAARKQQRITVGKVNGGNGKPPTQPTDDVRTPAKPIGFIGSTAAYTNPEGDEVGRVSLAWAHTGKATDGTAIDLDRFEFRIRDSVSGDANWQSFRSVPGAERVTQFSPVRVRFEDGTPAFYDFAIRAVAASGRTSGWVYLNGLLMETDSTPPPVPSAPVGVAAYGQIIVAWNGLGAGDEPMPPDFLHTECEIGSSPAGPWKFVSNFERAGATPTPFALDYGTYWLRLRSVDRVGNKSEWSELADVTTTPLVELPDISDLIDGINTQFEDVRHSANGANRRIDSTSDPVIDGKERDGDTWWKWTDGAHIMDPKILIGQWTWMGDEWEPMALGHQVIGSLDLGTAIVGQLDGIHIKAGTLSAGHIIVSDFENLATLNPDLGFNVTIPGEHETETVGNRARKKAGGLDRLVFMDQGVGVPVESEDWIRVSFNASASSATSVIPRVWVNGPAGALATFDAGPKPISSGVSEYTYDIKIGDLAAVSGGTSWYVGLQGAGARLLSVRNVRVYKKTSATLIAPDSIRTPHLGAEIINSGHIKANGIETDRLVGGFADFITITGSLLQTMAASNRGLKMRGDLNTFEAFNNNSERTVFINGATGSTVIGKNSTFSVDGATGNLTIGNGKFNVAGSSGNVEMVDAKLTAGQVIGANIQGGSITMTGDGSGDYTIGMRGSAEGGYLAFWTPDTDTEPDVGATIRAGATEPGSYHGPGNAQLVLRAPRVAGSSDERASVWLQSHGVDNGRFDQPVVAIRGDIVFTGTSAITGAFNMCYDAAPGFTVDLGDRAQSVRSTVIRDSPYTFAPNVYITSNGFIGQTSSASRFKLDPQTMDLSDELLSIPVKDWIDKSSHDQAEELRMLGVRTAEQQPILDSIADELRVPGVVAEDVEAVSGGEKFVMYNADGDTQGVAYDRLAIAQVAVLKRQLAVERQRNDDLEVRLKALEESL